MDREGGTCLRDSFPVCKVGTMTRVALRGTETLPMHLCVCVWWVGARDKDPAFDRDGQGGREISRWWKPIGELTCGSWREGSGLRPFCPEKATGATRTRGLALGLAQAVLQAGVGQSHLLIGVSPPPPRVIVKMNADSPPGWLQTAPTCVCPCHPWRWGPSRPGGGAPILGAAGETPGFALRLANVNPETGRSGWWCRPLGPEPARTFCTCTFCTCTFCACVRGGAWPRPGRVWLH